MGVSEFWDTTPRITALVCEGYRRRRAWAAFHAGYGMHAKDAKLEHLLGRAPAAASTPMSDEAMAQNIRRWRIATAPKTKREGLSDGQ
jgi:hypothetical protein